MILVTGATGTVGRTVAEALARRGVPARLASRRPATASAVRFDFADPAGHGPALAGVEAVFLLRPPQIARASAFEPFLAAARAAGVRRIVYLSVRGAERIRLLPHHGIERAVEASGIPFTHLRPNDFMQNFAEVHAPDIRERSEIWAPAGRGRASYIDVRDIGEAAARVLTEPGHEGRAYTLTGPQALTLDEVAAILSRTLGRPIANRNPGLPRFLMERIRGGTPPALALVMGAVYTIQRLGLAAEVTTDLEALMGRRPTMFEAFAGDYRDVWMP